MDSKAICLWLFSEHCFHATYSNIPVAEVSCVCSDIAWCPLVTLKVDSIILPHGKSHLSVKWELSNSPWNLHLRYRLPFAQSWRLTESVKLCVLQGRTDDYSSWLFGQCWIQYHCQELMYIINQEKTPLQMDITAAMLSLSLYRIIFRIFAFSDCILMCVLFVTTALQSSPVVWSVLECYQYSWWRYIKLVNLNLNLCRTTLTRICYKVSLC